MDYRAGRRRGGRESLLAKNRESWSCSVVLSCGRVSARRAAEGSCVRKVSCGVIDTKREEGKSGGWQMQRLIRSGLRSLVIWSPNVFAVGKDLLVKDCEQQTFKKASCLFSA